MGFSLQCVLINSRLQHIITRGELLIFWAESEGEKLRQILIKIGAQFLGGGEGGAEAPNTYAGH
jgi:hypothetical protein